MMKDNWLYLEAPKLMFFGEEKGIKTLKICEVIDFKKDVFLKGIIWKSKDGSLTYQKEIKQNFLKGEILDLNLTIEFPSEFTLEKYEEYENITNL